MVSNRNLLFQGTIFRGYVIVPWRVVSYKFIEMFTFLSLDLQFGWAIRNFSETGVDTRTEVSELLKQVAVGVGRVATISTSGLLRWRVCVFPSQKIDKCFVGVFVAELHQQKELSCIWHAYYSGVGFENYWINIHMSNHFHTIS